MSFSYKFWIAFFVVGLVALGFLFYVLAVGSSRKAEASSIETISNKGEIEVNVGDRGFSPQTVSVASGATVKWTNIGNTPHTITFNYGTSLDNIGGFTQELNAEETIAFKFERLGVFRYFDKHSSFTGSVEVK